ncbi:MAG: hypothetical protein OJF58_001588 [Enhydrobacter sp.]|nr:MAG: hypothetical protein OJF58_001588 [Enhydrobacter sp.]
MMTKKLTGWTLTGITLSRLCRRPLKMLLGQCRNAALML